MSSQTTPDAGGTVVAAGFGWRHASRLKPTLTDVSFTIDAGEKVLVLGASGAGKSTLLAGIAGVLGAQDAGSLTGSITVNGHDPRHTRGLVGMVLQDPDSQVISSRVGDDVVFGCENLLVDRDEMWQRARWALDMVGLDLEFSHPTSELSGGQKQRLALAGVIAMGAKVIVLDEPTANLDPEGVSQVVDSVTKVVRQTGATLIVVEHRVDIWSQYVDRVLVVGAGSDGIIADGLPGEVIESHRQMLDSQGVWLPGVSVSLPPACPIEPPPHPAENSSDNLVNKENDAAGRKPALGDRASESGVQSSVSASPVALWTQDLAVGWDGKEVGSRHTLAIPAGASTVITGANGAGKSTLALTLAGLLAPVGGTVSASRDLRDGLAENPHEWGSRELACRIGFVFQDPEHQFVAPTVREELAVGPRVLAGKKKTLANTIFGRRGKHTLSAADNERIDELLARLSLDHLAEANPFSLSGGQKRRLSVATALVTAPQVVFFDEPTFGQDRKTFTELVVLLRQLADAGTTIVSITHDTLFTRALADHHVVVG